MKSAAVAIAAFAAARPEMLAAPARQLAPLKAIKIARIWTLDIKSDYDEIRDEYGFPRYRVKYNDRLELNCRAFYRQLDPLPKCRTAMEIVTLQGLREYGLDPGLARYMEALPGDWMQMNSRVTMTSDSHGPLMIIEDNWRQYATIDPTGQVRTRRNKSAFSTSSSTRRPQPLAQFPSAHQTPSP